MRNVKVKDFGDMEAARNEILKRWNLLNPMTDQGRLTPPPSL
jgi:hypothetical protein